MSSVAVLPGRPMETVYFFSGLGIDIRSHRGWRLGGLTAGPSKVQSLGSGDGTGDEVKGMDRRMASGMLRGTL